MTAARMLMVLALSVPVAALSQQPTVDASAVAMRADPLPVLDDSGNVIPEDLIRATMRGPGRRVWYNPILGAIAGAVVLTMLAPDPPEDDDCSIYAPCTPREKVYRDFAPIVGLTVGALVGFAFPDGSVNRFQAVELLRARRRVDRAASDTAGGNPDRSR